MRIFNNGLLACAVMLATVAATVACMTQPATAQVAGQMSFDIPAGPMGAALAKLGQDAKLVIAFDPSLTRGRSSAALRGKMTAEQALNRLLHGTGIVALADATGGYTLAAVPPPASPRVSRSVPSAPASAPIRDLEASIVEQVIVTGQFFERALQETAASVVVLSGEDIAESSDSELYDVFLRTPNVSLSEDERQIVIRGINQGGFGGSTFNDLGQSTSGIYLDGVAVPVLGGPLWTWDMDSIEIFRSSQSTNQGRNALAGAVIMRSTDPTYEWEGKARVEFAGQDSQQFAAALNVPIVEGKLAARASISKEDTDGILPDRLDFEDHLFIRAKLRFEPTDDLSFILAYNRADRYEGADIAQNSALPALVVNAPETRKTITDVVSLTGNYQFNEQWAVTSITGYLKQNSLRNLAFGALTADIENGSESTSQEVRVVYQSDSLSATFGAYYLDLDLGQSLVIIAPGFFYGFPVAEINSTSGVGETRRNYAGFGEIEWRPSARWTLTAGVRYDREQFRNSQSSAGIIDTSTGTPLVPPSASEPTTTSYSAVLPKAIVTYNWTETIATSLLIQRGYRSGGTSISAISGVVAAYDPEHTWTYELALRSTFDGGRGVFNANIFRIDWRDMQLTRELSSVPFDSVTVNAGRSRVHGAEISASYRIRQGLDIFAGVGLLRARFLDFATDIGGVSVNYVGNLFPFASKFSGNAGVSYRHPSGVFAETNVTFRSGFFSTSANETLDRATGRTLVNASIGYDAAQWTVTLFARNLLNKKYYDGVFPSSDVVDLGRPRQIGVTLDAKF